MLRVARCIVHGVCCTSHVLNAPSTCCNWRHAMQCTGTVAPVHACCMCVLRVVHSVAYNGICCTLRVANYDVQHTARMLHHGMPSQRTGTVPVPARSLPHRHSRSLCMPIGCSCGTRRPHPQAAPDDRCALAAGEYSQYPRHGHWTVAVGDHSQYPVGDYSEYPRAFRVRLCGRMSLCVCAPTGKGLIPCGVILANSAPPTHDE
jgi:hypothetical protein